MKKETVREILIEYWTSPEELRLFLQNNDVNRAYLRNAFKKFGIEGTDALLLASTYLNTVYVCLEEWENAVLSQNQMVMNDVRVVAQLIDGVVYVIPVDLASSEHEQYMIEWIAEPSELKPIM